MKEGSEKIQRFQKLRSMISQLIAAQRRLESMDDQCSVRLINNAAERRNELWDRARDYSKQVLGE